MTTMNTLTFTTLALLLVAISGVLSYPTDDIRRNFQLRSREMRVGVCESNEVEHTICYTCARLYDYLPLYKDCCLRTIMTPMLRMCQSLR